MDAADPLLFDGHGIDTRDLDRIGGQNAVGQKRKSGRRPGGDHKLAPGQAGHGLGTMHVGDPCCWQFEFFINW